jgi:hypothetical protein
MKEDTILMMTSFFVGWERGWIRTHKDNVRPEEVFLYLFRFNVYDS